MSNMPSYINELEKENNVPEYTPSEVRVLTERLYNWLHLPNNRSLMLKFMHWHLSINDPGFQQHITPTRSEWNKRGALAAKIIIEMDGGEFDADQEYQELVTWDIEYNKTAKLTRDETLSLRRFMSIIESDTIRGLGLFWAARLCRIIMRQEAGLPLRKYCEY